MVPALIGLPALGTLISTTIVRVVESFLTKKAAKVALLTVIAGSMYLAMSTLFNWIGSEVSSLVSGVPVLETFGMFFPANVTQCLAAYASTEVAIFSYVSFHKVMKLKIEAVN